jgi:hypothetical protein
MLARKLVKSKRITPANSAPGVDWQNPALAPIIFCGARVMENSSNSAIMQAMEFSSPRVWWRRLRQKLGLGAKQQPVWGQEPPTILGICSHCGAVVLKGWHRQTPEGLLCQRCASKG